MERAYFKRSSPNTPVYGLQRGIKLVQNKTGVLNQFSFLNHERKWKIEKKMITLIYSFHIYYGTKCSF